MPRQPKPLGTIPVDMIVDSVEVVPHGIVSFWGVVGFHSTKVLVCMSITEAPIRRCRTCKELFLTIGKRDDIEHCGARCRVRAYKQRKKKKK